MQNDGRQCKNIHPAEFGEKSQRCKDLREAHLKASKWVGGQAKTTGGGVNVFFFFKFVNESLLFKICQNM